MHWLEPGSLWPRLQAATQHALACGALRPIHTRELWLEENGCPFLIHLAPALARKEKRTSSDQQPQRDPFLPYEKDLFVGDLSETHLCLLNKYNVFADHILIVTRQFEAQEAWLNEQDFAALAFCLQEIDGLAFYNSGKMAGASQPHKHLQLVPLPLSPVGPPLPVEPLWETAVYPQTIGHIPHLPFQHAIARLPGTIAPKLYHTYRTLMHHLHLLPDGASMNGICHTAYNLLATRRYMMIVPRTRDNYQGIPVNALGFAGSLLARDDADMQILRQQGPLRVLTNVARAKNT
ncbi:MAG: phosphorylase [Chloroflexi bacterium]|nr:phosphorylase [Chloroflexota bacterium]